MNPQLKVYCHPLEEIHRSCNNASYREHIQRRYETGIAARDDHTSYCLFLGLSILFCYDMFLYYLLVLFCDPSIITLECIIKFSHKLCSFTVLLFLCNTLIVLLQEFQQICCFGPYHCFVFFFFFILDTSVYFTIIFHWCCLLLAGTITI